MKNKRTCLVFALLAAVVIDAAWAACPPRVLTRLGPAAAEDRTILIDYWKTVSPGSQSERGLIVSLDLGGDSGAQLVAEIIRILPTPGPHLERIGRLKDVPGLEKEIRELGSGQPTLVQGTVAELRYADEVLPPHAPAAEFQALIPSGKVPDILDAAGDYHEIKYRNWTRLPPLDTIWAQDLNGVLAQAESIRSWAVSNGRSFTLAFEVPIPSSHRAMFDRFFDDLRSRPGITIVEGF